MSLTGLCLPAPMHLRRVPPLHVSNDHNKQGAPPSHVDLCASPVHHDFAASTRLQWGFPQRQDEAWIV